MCCASQNNERRYFLYGYGGNESSRGHTEYTVCVLGGWEGGLFENCGLIELLRYVTSAKCP